MTLRLEDLPAAAQAKLRGAQPTPARRRRKAEDVSELERELLTKLRWARYPEPDRQHRPIAGRRWTLDFAWPERLLGIEVDGGTWLKGNRAHGGHDGIQRGYEKHNALLLAGWRVLRFDADMVHDDRWMDVLGEAWDGRL